MTLDKTTAALLNGLLRELSTELELHYLDSDFKAISPTLAVMRKAAKAVRSSGYAVPDAYVHLVRRSTQALSSH